MSNCELVEKTVGQKLYSYLERNPNEYDVTFSVGPQKEEVKALKIILKASSAVFEKEFNEKWENSVMKEESGIPLPDLDPNAFRIFIKLVTSDTWSPEALKPLHLRPNDLFGLLAICKQFEVTTPIKHVEESVADFLKGFDSFVKTDEFMSMSKATLEACLSSNLVAGKESDIFEAVCKWAEFQCNTKQIEPNTTNIREELGSCLFEIRFPLMTLTDLKLLRFKNILTAEEKLSIYEFITGNREELNVDISQFPFKAQPREHYNLETLNLAEKLKVAENSLFECDGKSILRRGQVQYLNEVQIRSNQKVELHGLGFLGPVEADGFYEVTVQIKRITDQTHIYTSKLFKKIVFAQKGKTFYFSFDEPVTLRPITDTDNTNWDERYVINYWLKGPATLATDSDYGNKFSMKAGNVEFGVWSGDKQLVEIRFKEV